MHHRRINSPPLGAIRGVPIYTPLLCGGVVYIKKYQRFSPAESMLEKITPWFLILSMKIKAYDILTRFTVLLKNIK